MPHKSGVSHQASFWGPGGRKANLLGGCATGGGPEDEMLRLVSSRVSPSLQEDEKRAGAEGLNLKREEMVEHTLLSAPVLSGAVGGSGDI